MHDTLFEVEERLAMLLEKDLADNQIKDEVQHALVEAKEKRDHFTGYVLALEQRAKAIREHVMQLEDRARTMEARANRLKALASAVMQHLGHTKLEGTLHTITLYPGRNRVVVEDQESIPEKFMVVTKKPMLAAIGDAMDRGEEVPGAHQLPGPPTVRIYT